MNDVKHFGSKKKSETKGMRIFVRVTEEERTQLEEMSATQGKTVSDILRNGIRMQYNMHKILH